MYLSSLFQWEKMVDFAIRLIKREHLKVKGWDITKKYEEENRKVELLIQKLLEPDREKQTIGVKYKYPDSKVTALQI